MSVKPQVAASEAAKAAATAAGTTSAAAPRTRPLRRDAERNRRLILDAARTVFAQRGLDVSLDEVAREAGLGVGTVYRRFPNRDALIDALFDETLSSIEAIVNEARELPRAWDGLVHFMTAIIESQARDKGLRDAMIARQHHLATCGHPQESVIRAKLEPFLHDLIRRAQEAGDLRPDVSPNDFAVFLVATVSAAEFTAPAAPDTWRRHLAITLDGLRARPADTNTPLTEPPLDADQVEVCMAGWKYGSREGRSRDGL